MLKFIVTALTFAMLGGIATADQHKGRHDNRRPVVRENRSNQPTRVNRPAQRANRKAMNRRAVYSNNGNFVFASGNTYVYTRPVIRARYYNARVRPQLVVENYRAEPGYIWVRGQWTWGGSEWRWSDGHYMADPQYATYYDDGSFDYSINITIGG